MFFDKDLLMNTLENLPSLIEEFIKNIPAEALDRKRNAETWTIREHIYHIVNVQDTLYNRIMKIKNEEQPVIVPYFPENETARDELYGSVSEALSEYKAIRKKQIQLISELTEASMKKEAEHGEYISYNIPIIVNHMIFHEYWHMYRIEQIWLLKDENFA